MAIYEYSPYLFLISFCLIYDSSLTVTVFLGRLSTHYCIDFVVLHTSLLLPTCQMNDLFHLLLVTSSMSHYMHLKKIFVSELKLTVLNDPTCSSNLFYSGKNREFHEDVNFNFCPGRPVDLVCLHIVQLTSSKLIFSV